MYNEKHDQKAKRNNKNLVGNVLTQLKEFSCTKPWKPLRKKLENKLKKKPKNKIQLPNVNKKSQSKKQNFVQTPFFHFTIELESKEFTTQKPLAFSLHFLLSVTKIISPIWLQNHENV